jgi:tetratricopeptide (TPR) repeat protein
MFRNRFSTMVLVVIGAALLLQGCATRQEYAKVKIPPGQMQTFLGDKPQKMHPAYRRLLEEGKRNSVLNNMEIALDAYQLGYPKLARRSLDTSLNVINSVYADNKKAAEARSLWYEEGRKDFKGEPYERAMAFYYRGLMFIEDGDYENARAAFKSGMLQDAFAEEKQNQCDYASLLYLEAWASQLAGDQQLAGTAFDMVKKMRPDLPINPSNNTLLIVETGKSPRKLADGPGHAEMVFRRGRNFTEYRVEVAIDDGRFQTLHPFEDVYWQATTRGGRPIDKIIKGKVSFRGTNAKIGSTLGDISEKVLLASQFFNNSGALQVVGASLGVISVTQMVIAAKTMVRADTRYWDNLPDTSHMLPLKLSPGDHTLNFRYRDRNGALIPSLARQRSITVASNKQSLIWERSRLQMSKSQLY